MDYCLRVNCILSGSVSAGDRICFYKDRPSGTPLACTTATAGSSGLTCSVCLPPGRYYIKNETTGKWASAPSPLIVGSAPVLVVVQFPRSTGLDTVAVADSVPAAAADAGEGLEAKSFLYLFAPEDLAEKSPAELQAYADRCAERGDHYELFLVSVETRRNAGNPIGPSQSDTEAILTVWSDHGSPVEDPEIKPMVWEEPGV